MAKKENLRHQSVDFYEKLWYSTNNSHKYRNKFCYRHRNRAAAADMPAACPDSSGAGFDIRSGEYPEFSMKSRRIRNEKVACCLAERGAAAVVGRL